MLSSSIKGIDNREDRKLDKVEILRYATCSKFKSVKYIRMLELLDKLSVTKNCGTLKKLLKFTAPWNC